MTINCTYCNKEFYKKPSHIKRSKNHFCSKDCQNKWQKGRVYPERQNRIKHNCHQCNKNIRVENYKYKRFLKGEIKNLFCDKHCLAAWQKEHFKGEKSPVYNRIIKNCLYCNKEYSIPKSEEETSKYCTAKCHSNSRIVDIDVVCDYCKKHFTKKKATIKNRNFCSRKCSHKWTSENNNFQTSKKCLICDKEYVVHRSRVKTTKTCSKKCHGKWLKKIYSSNKEMKLRLVKNGIKSMMLQNNSSSETKPERIVRELLIHKNIKYIPQHLMYDKFIVDFYLPNHNIIIEVFGDYWHGNPLFYGEGENIKPLSERQIKQKKKDKARKAYLKECGHQFHILWEHDIYNNLLETTKFL